MSRGYRGILIALAGLAACYPISERADAQTGPAENQAEAASNTEPSPPPIENSVDRIASAIEAERANGDSQSSQERAERDLNAQENMAFWALWMFIATAMTTVISAVGIVLIWRTLIATRSAARFAGEAVEEARKGTTAALGAAEAGHTANAIARESSEKQLRPYMHVDEITAAFTTYIPHIDLAPGGCFITIQIKNFGQTPARQIHVYVGERIVLPIDTQPFFPTANPVKSADLGPGAFLPIRQGYFSLDGEYERIKGATLALLVTGRIEYTDVFDNRWQTEFRFISWGVDFAEGIFVPDTLGNSAT